ncbi:MULTISPECIES: PIN domain-containing protein [unclassified Streptomyces]|uniref:PIN domain-containing protein n=1 Tax=unclassified Streptomyces TaxID=2593676 RepID=UPI0020248919|nr:MULTISPECIES: PIN domain-containing protein [unclassified Streptomyces]WSC21255.1 DNA-binding protein [Streptomyces sp. NBC_01766]WSV55191.1 DNA-binding protein [Streptomyces sp. NBC_01014]
MTEHGFRVVVLDSEGLSGWIAEDRRITGLVKVFRQGNADFVISAATIIEVTHAKVNTARLNWLLSRIRIEPLTEQASRAAAALLKKASLHGHKYAIDAMVAEVALRQAGPVALLTSDIGGMRKLCGTAVHLVGV